jgi:hypothetical protein
MSEPAENAGIRPRRARQTANAASASQADRLHTSPPAPFITINYCKLSIERNCLEIFVLITVVSLMMVVSFILPSAAGLDAAFSKLQTIATGALCSVSSFPLKPAFDRFSRVLLLRQARKTLEMNEPLSQIQLSELRLLPQKKGFLR